MAKADIAVSPRALTYIRLVIAAGMAALTAGLADLKVADGTVFASCLAAAVLLPLLRLRLPRLPASYSAGFLPILWGVAHLSLAETLLAACAGAVSQSCLRSPGRPKPEQVLFNMASLTLSVSACFWFSGWLRMTGVFGAGFSSPAAMAFCAAVYFVVNTTLVSGVLALLGGKPLREVVARWYTWSLPYHMAGASALSLVPGPGTQSASQGALMVISLLLLIHFFCSLEHRRPRRRVAAEGFPLPAAIYVAGVIALGTAATAANLTYGGMPHLRQFGWWALAITVASVCKVALPGTGQSVSLNFMVLLIAVTELTGGEACVLGVIAAVVQCLWRPKSSPRLVKVAFSAGALALSAAVASAVSHLAFGSGERSLNLAFLATATTVLYASNTLLVNGVIGLITGNFSGAWKCCHFWVFGYYMAGTSAAGLMISTGRTFGWPAATLVFPAVLLTFMSYRLHVENTQRQAADCAVPATA